MEQAPAPFEKHLTDLFSFFSMRHTRVPPPSLTGDEAQTQKVTPSKPCHTFFPLYIMALA